MNIATQTASATRNIASYPWFKFLQNLLFWQAIWFLYFQNELSAADAIVLYAIYDIATTALEVPSGYMSDRLGRRLTLIASALAGCGAMALLAIGGGFEVFAAGQILLGASMAFSSGTDSALLYESLSAEGRRGEIEQQELRAWRFTFVALAISAVLGGLMVNWGAALPYAFSALTMAAALVVAWRFAEPPHAASAPAMGDELLRVGSLRSALTEPVLIWLLALSVLMYVFSHLLFVFGQPFILQALEGTGLAGDAPMVSGVVSAIMMAVSVGTSLLAYRLRQRVGLAAILLFAFALQIGLIAVMAVTNEAIVIAVLFLRMVPNSLSRPFILARIQPVLGDESRATYMSLQSFAGRLILAAMLYLVSLTTSTTGEMPYADLQRILGWHVLGGVVCFAAIALAARRVRIEPEQPGR
ncbi:MFS transporter [Rhodobacteraceae bacterium NNCM2]|nr:MFS transporter [Coraliihabitans acroporae]